MAEMTIGADPEYGLLSEGRLVSASGTISGSTETAFGVDGCGRVAELRPTYAKSPSKLVENIHDLLLRGVTGQPNLLAFKFKAGSVVVDEPIGGHVHFGSTSLRNAGVATRLSDALDRTASVLVMMIEDPEEALNRRIGSNYGSVGNGAWREQSWGMEYRVLPSWLTHPIEAKAILSLCWAIAKEHDNQDIMDEAASLPGFDTQSFKECDKMGLLYHIPPIVKFIRSLPTYPEHEQAIKPIFQLIKSRKVWSCDKDMLDTWGIREEVKKTEKKAKKPEPVMVTEDEEDDE